MKLKTAIAIAAAAAFAVPLAASAEADKAKAKAEAEAGATAQGGFDAVDRNKDGYISRDEARDADWSNRFSELDKDNDGRLSRSEFDAMQAASGGSASDRTATPPKHEAGAHSKPKQQ